MMFRTLLTATLLFASTASTQMVPWTTRAGDNARTGWNSHETALTQASVTAKGVTLRPRIPVIGDARGTEAQPLIQTGVATSRGNRDVMILASMADIVRGVDAHDGSAIWQTTLGTSVCPSGNQADCSLARIDFHRINQHWGCLSTGVIVGNVWYGVCLTSTDSTGSLQSGRYVMYSLNIQDGSQAAAPVNIQGSDTSMWKQRASLAYDPVNDLIYIAHGSVFETSTGYTGGITAFSRKQNCVVAYLPMTSGIWMAGSGLSVDTQGYVYAITGNGDFDPTKGWFGESFIKVKYTAGTLAVVDQWSPWSDYQRSGQQTVPAGKPAGMSMPTEEAKPVGGSMSMEMKGATLKANFNDQGNIVTLVYPPPMASGGWSDEDWGSAGPACLFQLNVCVAAGKDGIGYPISTSSLGRTTVATVGSQVNYAALASPCVWLTMSPGNVPCAPVDPRTLNFFPNGVTAHLHMTPVQFYNPVLKKYEIAVWGENARLHLWTVDPVTKKLQYVAESLEYASNDVRTNTPGGMPGGFCSGSSNGQDPLSYLLMCSIPYGDANATLTTGRLLIYDPIHIDANGHIPVLWDSQRWGIPFQFNKFLPPVVDGGEIILPDYAGSAMLFGQN